MVLMNTGSLYADYKRPIDHAGTVKVSARQIISANRLRRSKPGRMSGKQP